MSNREMVISRVKDSYAGHFKYESDSIHEALDKYHVLEMLMVILTEEMPKYKYKLSFTAKDNVFTNELIIFEEDGAEGQDNTRDTPRHENEESSVRGNSEHTV